MKKNLFAVCLILIMSSCGLFNNGGGGSRVDTATNFCSNVTCTDGKACYIVSGVAQCYAPSSACDPICDSNTSSCVDVNGTPTCVSTGATKEITAFSIAPATVIISGANISVTLPCGSSVTSLIPTITHTGVSISPASGVAKDFTSPVIYTVMATDGLSQAYTVIVVVKTLCALREIGPAGGLVFYDKGSISNGWRYLEAAPSDQSSSQAWSNITNVSIVPNTGQAIGTGEANTDAIIAQSGHVASAAKLCKDLMLGGYDDWFLPSILELDKMMGELSSHGYGGFVAGEYYWSSTENNANTAVHTIAGGWSSSNKDVLKHVRCVRVF